MICGFCAYGMMRGGYLAGIVLCGFGLIDGRMSYGTMAAENYPLDYDEKPHTLEEVQSFYNDGFAAVGLRQADFSYKEEKNRNVITDFDL